MLHSISIKCKVDVMYFIFIFISASVPRFSVKKSVNQLIKNKRPYYAYQCETVNLLKIPKTQNKCPVSIPVYALSILLEFSSNLSVS